jgi:hypothetical protein
MHVRGRAEGDVGQEALWERIRSPLTLSAPVDFAPDGMPLHWYARMSCPPRPTTSHPPAVAGDALARCAAAERRGRLPSPADEGMRRAWLGLAQRRSRAPEVRSIASAESLGTPASIRALCALVDAYNLAYFNGRLPRLELRWGADRARAFGLTYWSAADRGVVRRRGSRIAVVLHPSLAEPVLCDELHETLLHELCHVASISLTAPDVRADGAWHAHGPTWRAFMALAGMAPTVHSGWPPAVPATFPVSIGPRLRRAAREAARSASR